MQRDQSPEKAAVSSQNDAARKEALQESAGRIGSAQSAQSSLGWCHHLRSHCRGIPVSLYRSGFIQPSDSWLEVGGNDGVLDRGGIHSASSSTPSSRIGIDLSF